MRAGRTAGGGAVADDPRAAIRAGDGWYRSFLERQRARTLGIVARRAASCIASSRPAISMIFTAVLAACAPGPDGGPDRRRVLGTRIHVGAR